MSNTRLKDDQGRRPSLIDNILWCVLDTIFATHLDRLAPFDEKSRDGTGIVTAMAVFVITQGGFVASSIKDAKSGPKLWALFAIYVVLFALSFIGLEVVLRLTNNRNEKRIRTFDRVSILYARWVLLCGIVVIVLLTMLARYNLLPGQPTRYDFEGELTATSQFASDFARGTSADAPLKTRTQAVMDRWVKSLATAYSKTAKTTLLVLRQNQPFKRDYFPVRADVTINGDFTIGDRFAFLVKEDSPPLQLTGAFGDYYLPDYRQVPFEPAEKDGRLPSHRLRLPAPNAGEQLVVVLAVSANEGKELPLNAKDFGCILVMHRQEDFMGN
jgi:hypothetical protein